MLVLKEFPGRSKIIVKATLNPALTCIWNIGHAVILRRTLGVKEVVRLKLGLKISVAFR